MRNKTLSLAAMLVIFLAPLASPQSSPVPSEAKPPALSELENTKLENIQLKFRLLQVQQQALQEEYQTLVSQVQAEHPGYALDQQTNSLKPVPKPAPKKK